jgi:hypothetical protein
MVVEDGDVTLVPKGYHPCAAIHGYELYYLNVMAGPGGPEIPQRQGTRLAAEGVNPGPQLSFSSSSPWRSTCWRLASSFRAAQAH